MNIFKPSIFILMVISSIFFVGCSENNATTESSKESNDLQTDVTAQNEAVTPLIEDKQSVAPPFEELDVPFKKESFQPKQPQLFSFDNGTTIEVPANAFVDAKGQPVTGEVTLEYREIRKPSEIIASGIPMRYFDENNEEQWMQTAGMFEIKGSVNDDPVFIAEGKEITVNMSSELDGAYDTWFFDEKEGNWVYQGNAAAKPNPKLNNATDPINRKKDKVVEAPTPPAKIDPAKFPIDYNVDYSKFPELAKKKDIVWQYVGTNKEEVQEMAGHLWEEISLSKGKKGQYFIDLKADTLEYKIPVEAGLSNQDYETAMVAYQKKLEDYKKWKAAFADKEAFQKKQNQFLRTMMVRNFGIHNYDIIWKMENPLPLAANFEIDLGPELNQYVKVFLITKERRTVVDYPRYNWKKFAFDPELENQIVAVLPGNRIALFTQQNFVEQKQPLKEARNKSYNFVMNENEAVNSLEDLERLIEESGE